MARRIALVLLSAAAHAFVLPPWSAWPAAGVALVPLLVALRDVGSGAAALLGLVFGTAAIWGVGWWVPGALSFYYQQPAWFGFGFAAAASVVFAGSYAAGFAACAAAFMRRVGGLPRVMLVAATWVAWELVRARVGPGDPWLLIGYALGASPVLRQSADLGGVYLLSFVVVLVNAAMIEALGGAPRQRWPALLGAVGFVLACACYGVVRLHTTWPGETVPVLVVQGDNPVGVEWHEDDYGRGLDRYLALTQAGAETVRSRLVVWPESAVTFFLADDRSYRGTIGRVLSATGAELILGGPFRDGSDSAGRYFNSAFHLRADGTLDGRYDKGHLLPFAEYFPLRTITLLRRRFERVPYFTPGDDGPPLVTSFGAVATVICFEAIFPEIVRERMAAGARLLVNLSNDAWLGTGAGREQHLAMVALRAVEHRTWVVRATTTGISALIDPAGCVVARAEPDRPTTLAGTIVPLDVPTVYERVGDAFAYGCALIVAGAGLVLARRSPS